MRHQVLVGDRAGNALDLGIHEPRLGLRVEAGVRMLDREDTNEALAHIVAADRGILVFEKIVGLRVLVDRAGERGAEACEMRAAVRIRDGVCETKNLVVVAVVVLQHDIEVHVVGDLVLILVAETDLALAENDDRLGVEELLVLTELAHEFLDAQLVKPAFRFDRLAALVGERDFESWIEEGEFAQAGGEFSEFEFRRDREDRRIRHEGDQRAGLFFVFHLADDIQLLRGDAALEGHVIDLAVALDLDLEPIAERIDALRADAVQTAGVFVSALAEFAARVEVCENEFERGDFEFRMDIDRDAAAVVADRARAIHMDRHIDLRAIAGEVFVDRVVENLENAVVEAAFIRGPDIHAGALADAGEAFEFVNFGGVVFFAFGSGILFVGHAGFLEKIGTAAEVAKC